MIQLGTPLDPRPQVWTISDGSVWATNAFNARFRVLNVVRASPMNGVDMDAVLRLAAAAPTLVALARRVARLIPDAGEIGAGMLAQLVADARAAVIEAEGSRP